MKRLAKFVSLLMAIVMLTSLCACQDANSDKNDTSWKDVQIPDSVNYFNSGKQYDFYTYGSINVGSYSIYNEDYYVGESFLDEEHIQWYFDSGMKFLSPQVAAPAPGNASGFAGSKLKQVMDICHDLGYDKSVVLLDNSIYSPYHQAQSEVKNGAWQNETDWDKITCIGTQYNWQWDTWEDLVRFMKDRLSIYCQHPAFQGVFMPDEPQGRYMRVIGETYKALRQAQQELGIEEMFININLFPYYTNLVTSSYPVVEGSFHSDQEQRQHEAYRRYIKAFLEYSDADYVQADIYPMGEASMYRLYLVNLQIMAEVAKEYDAKIIVVNQTHANVGQRRTSYESLKYQNNIAFGFGAVNNGYYSWKTLDDGNGYDHFDDGSMTNRFGEKTYVYDIVKDLNAEAQKLALSILNFDYTASAGYESEDKYDYNDAMIRVLNYSRKNEIAPFTKLADYDINKDYSIVTELYDSEKDNYMYMAMNTTDPMYTSKGSRVYQTATLTFTSEFNKALVFYNGSYKVYNLDADSSLTVKMRPGEAHYVIPYFEAV